MSYALLSHVDSEFNLKFPEDFDLEVFCSDFCNELYDLYITAVGNTCSHPVQHTKESIRSTRIWSVLNRIYQYAELGNPEFLWLTNNEWQFDDDDFLYAVEWFNALKTLDETSGGFSFKYRIFHGIHMLHKFIARFKLDSNGNFAGYCDDHYPIAGSEFFFPLVHKTHFSLFEIALLAGMGTIRSVRNATYDKKDPLKVIKEGNKVFVEISEARRWLKERRGFVPTKGIQY